MFRSVPTISTFCFHSSSALRPSRRSRPCRARPTIAPAQAIHARNGMVVAQESRAARIGVEILDRGGNAVDAAVAIGFALAVTYPRAGNIGGGGFMVIHLAKDNRDVDHRLPRNRAGGRNRHDVSRRQGEPDPKKSRDSALVVGVPGTVAGLAMALEKYGSGKFTLADLIAPAHRPRAEGISGRGRHRRFAPAGARAPCALACRRSDFPQRRRPMLATGERLLQFDLADTLRAIAQRWAGRILPGPHRRSYCGRSARGPAAS